MNLKKRVGRRKLVMTSRSESGSPSAVCETLGSSPGAALDTGPLENALPAGSLDVHQCLEREAVVAELSSSDQPFANASQSAQSPSQVDSSQSGRIFGSHHLLWEISRDALSTTYACERDGVDTLLSVRIFNDRFKGEAQVRQIQRSAKTAAELTHPNIITVYEHGVGEDGAPYVVSDWVESDSLADVLGNSKRLDIARFLNIFQQVCDALIEAHSRQLLHRNLAPDKVILVGDTDGHEFVKMTEFGMPPNPVEHAFYMSPEQCIDGNRIDARADVYSLGCIMYEALVGNPPFVGYGAKQASLDCLHDLANRYSPQSPEHKALKLLDCIVAKCLQQKPSKRFGSVRELSGALRLVNDCICGGSTRRLPAAAEKLLLFRFLDIFDRKIIACGFVYLLLGMLSVKFLGEMQLQKQIDAAQLAEMSGDQSRAQTHWKDAIRQADSMGKPPSLRADLHWALGDTYRYQAWSECNSPSNGSLAKDAILEYKQSLDYFGHGAHFRHRAIALWQSVASLWEQVDRVKPGSGKHREIELRAKRLFAAGKFAECATLCSSFLKTNHDHSLASLAACAYTELGIKAPPTKGLRLFERAQYYLSDYNCSSADGQNNLSHCMSQLKQNIYSSESYKVNARRALLDGDVEAAISDLAFVPAFEYQELRQALLGYLRLRRNDSEPPISKDSALEAVAALEQSLKLEQIAYGEHSNQISHTLSRLAELYRIAGDHEKAISSFKRFFSLEDLESVSDSSLYLDYVDMLAKHGRNREAIAFLSRAIATDEEDFDWKDKYLSVRLIKAYMDGGQRSLAEVTLEQLVGEDPSPRRAGEEIIEANYRK